MLERLKRPSSYLPILSLILVLGGWEIVGRSIDPLLFAPPSAVIGMFGELMATGELQAAATITMQALFLGYALAVIVGIPFGILMGAAPRFGDILQPYLYAIFSDTARRGRAADHRLVRHRFRRTPVPRVLLVGDRDQRQHRTGRPACTPGPGRGRPLVPGKPRPASKARPDTRCDPVCGGGPKDRRRARHRRCDHRRDVPADRRSGWYHHDRIERAYPRPRCSAPSWSSPFSAPSLSQRLISSRSAFRAGGEMPPDAEFPKTNPVGNGSRMKPGDRTSIRPVRNLAGETATELFKEETTMNDHTLKRRIIGVGLGASMLAGRC